MEWLKAIVAIIFFAGVLVFLPLESTAGNDNIVVNGLPKVVK